MARRIPSLSALSAFDAAARLSSFSLAADELSVTPGAVSRQIQKLEANLGIQLFERTKRSIALTALGRGYAIEVATILNQLEIASDRFRSRSQFQPLSVCAYPAFALRWLIPRWRKFHERHPNIDLQLTTSLAPAEPVRDGFDAVVRLTNERFPATSSILLAPVDIFPVCRPDLRKKIRKTSDLRAQTLIHCHSRPNDWLHWLRKAGASDAVDATRGPTFESLSLAYQAAIEGVGVAMGLGCLVADDIDLGRLVKPLPFSYRSKLAFHLLYRTARETDPRMSAFCDFLREEAAELEKRS
jgi:LysR family glycine cleavage system transcriptional activator